jgi:hypothetical protein
MNESPSFEESQRNPGALGEPSKGPTPEAEGEMPFRKKKARRLDLIDKQYCEGLSDAESTELAALQTEVAAQVNRKFPLPSMEPTTPGTRTA